MGQTLMTYASILAMGFSVLLYLQTNFVSAMDFQQSQEQRYEDKIFTLVVKQVKLQEAGKELEPWEKAELERARTRLEKLINK